MGGIIVRTVRVPGRDTGTAGGVRRTVLGWNTINICRRPDIDIALRPGPLEFHFGDPGGGVCIEGEGLDADHVVGGTGTLWGN